MMFLPSQIAFNILLMALAITTVMHPALQEFDIPDDGVFAHASVVPAFLETSEFFQPPLFQRLARNAGNLPRHIQVSHWIGDVGQSVFWGSFGVLQNRPILVIPIL